MRVAARAPAPSATKAAPAPIAAPIQRVFASKVTIERTTLDVPMLVPRGEWLKAIGFPIGATAFLPTEKHGDITLPTRCFRSGCDRTRLLQYRSHGIQRFVDERGRRLLDFPERSCARIDRARLIA
jgi:hypothetical protein